MMLAIRLKKNFATRGMQVVSLTILFSLSLALLFTWGCSKPAESDPSALVVDFPVDSAPVSDSLPKAYTDLAQLLSDGPYSHKKLPAESLDLAAVRARIQSRLLDLKQIETTDQDIQFIRDEVVLAMEESMRISDTLAELPSSPDLVNQISTSIMLTVLGKTDTLIENDQVIAQQNTFIEVSFKKLAACDRRFKSAVLMLKPIAKNHTASTINDSHLIEIDVDEAWPTPDSAWLVLVNRSGKELHNCTFSVQLMGPDEKYMPHLHFKATWLPGQPLFFYYDRGIKLGDALLGDGMPSRIDRVEVDLYAREFSQENITFDYSSAERDKDILRYCEELKFSARFQDFKSGVFKSDLPAIMCKFTGTRLLPEGTVTILLPDGQSNTAHFQQWIEHKELEVQFRDLYKLPPRWELQLKFKGSNVIVTRHFGK